VSIDEGWVDFGYPHLVSTNPSGFVFNYIGQFYGIKSLVLGKITINAQAQ
jgi:hypothetical protein